MERTTTIIFSSPNHQVMLSAVHSSFLFILSDFLRKSKGRVGKLCPLPSALSFSLFLGKSLENSMEGRKKTFLKK